MGSNLKTSVTELYNGVSRQPDERRFKGQVQDSENMWHGIEDAVKRRPATRRLDVDTDNLQGYTNFDPMSAYFNRRTLDFYISANNGDKDAPATAIHRFNLGSNTAVETSEYAGDKSFNINEVYGETFAVDEEAVPEIANSRTIDNADVFNVWGVFPRGDNLQDHLFVARNMEAGQTQTFTYNPFPEDASDVVIRAGSSGKLAQEVITEFLGALDVVNADANTYRFPNVRSVVDNTLTIERFGDCLYIYRTRFVGTIFTNFIEETGSTEQYGSKVFNHTTPSLDFLPPEAPNNYYIRVGQDITGGYFVRYETDTMRWIEAYNPAFDNTPQNLPRIIGEIVNYFVDKEIGFIIGEDRFGNDTLIDIPPMFTTATSSEIGGRLGQPLYGLFPYRNRLGIIYAGGILFSKTDRPYDLWTDSATQFFDTDGFGLRYPLEDFSVRWAVPYRDSLFLMGETHQYELRSGDNSNFSATSVEINLATSYNANINARPAVVGDKLYFASDIKDTSRLYEYHYDELSLSNTAEDVSLHTAGYIPANIVSITGHTPSNSLFVLSADEPNSIYNYRTYYEGRRKIQSSWSRWSFHFEILNTFVWRDDLILVMKDGDGIRFEAMPLIADYEDNGGISDVFLDGLEEYDGQATDPVPDKHEIVMAGKEGSERLYIGRKYTSKLVFSKLYPYIDNRNLPITEGRGRLHQYEIQFKEVGRCDIVSTDSRGSGKPRRRAVNMSPVAYRKDFRIKCRDNGDVEHIRVSVETNDSHQMSIIKIDYTVFWNDVIFQDRRSR